MKEPAQTRALIQLWFSEYRSDENYSREERGMGRGEGWEGVDNVLPKITGEQNGVVCQMLKSNPRVALQDEEQ